MERFESPDGRKIIYKSLWYTFSTPTTITDPKLKMLDMILRMRFLEEIGFWWWRDSFPLFVRGINNQRHLIGIPELKVDIHKYILLPGEWFNNFLKVFQKLDLLYPHIDYPPYFENHADPLLRPRMTAQEMAERIINREKQWYLIIDSQYARVDQAVFEQLIQIEYAKDDKNLPENKST